MSRGSQRGDPPAPNPPCRFRTWPRPPASLPSAYAQPQHRNQQWLAQQRGEARIGAAGRTWACTSSHCPDGGSGAKPHPPRPSHRGPTDACRTPHRAGCAARTHIGPFTPRQRVWICGVEAHFGSSPSRCGSAWPRSSLQHHTSEASTPFTLSVPSMASPPDPTQLPSTRH